MENFIDKNLAVGNISNLIHRIRGYDVILDADLAKIYGYTTKAFNQQVLRNRVKFEGEEFMFQLTKDELGLFVRSHFVTSRKGNLFSGQDGGTRYLPYVFTEQGIYMLMTVLRGELATRQSRALVIAFKKMKDYILENQKLLEHRGGLQLAMKVLTNTEDITRIKAKLTALDEENSSLRDRMNAAVMRSEISPIMLNFNDSFISYEYIIMNGDLLEAKETYQSIYAKAANSIIIVDNYIDIQTLRLLGKTRPGTTVTIFSDNIRNYLHSKDYADFRTEYPSVNITFLRTNNTIHDRFIILDYCSNHETIYHCGASSKDAGKTITMISEICGELAKQSIHLIIDSLRKNPELILS